MMHCIPLSGLKTSMEKWPEETEMQFLAMKLFLSCEPALEAYGLRHSYSLFPFWSKSGSSVYQRKS